MQQHAFTRLFPANYTWTGGPPPSSRTSSNLTWLIIGIFVCLSGMMFVSLGFRIRSIPAVSIVSSLFLGVALTQSLGFRSHLLRRSRVALIAVIQSAAVLQGGIFLTYAAAKSPRPLADELLMKIDRAIGYDWVNYAQFFINHPLIANLVVPDYWLIAIMPYFILGTLALTRQDDRLEKYILVMIVSLTITATLFFFYPATTAWTSQNFSNEQIMSYKYLPTHSSSWIHNLREIRRGQGNLLCCLGGDGLVAFPSFHCVSAVVFVWALWHVQLIRPAVLLLNGLMVAATPIIGGHYLIDLIGGAGVAVASILFVGWMHPRLPGLFDLIRGLAIKGLYSRATLTLPSPQPSSSRG
jgi:hypothetical protein